MGKDDISADDLVKKLKYSLPLGKLALTETLNKFKDEYQERVLQGSGSSLLGGSRDGGNIEVSEGDGGRNSRRNRQRESERLRAERGRDVVEAAMEFTDSHINAIAKAYYADENFGRAEIASDIDLWRVYNLFTGANKSSYIDTFLDRSLNATNLISGIGRALEGDNEYAWFIE